MLLKRFEELYSPIRYYARSRVVAKGTIILHVQTKYINVISCALVDQYGRSVICVQGLAMIVGHIMTLYPGD